MRRPSSEDRNSTPGSGWPMSLPETPSVRPTDREPRHRLDAAEVVEDLRVRKDAAHAREALLWKSAARKVDADHALEDAIGEMLLEQRDVGRDQAHHCVAGQLERGREPSGRENPEVGVKSRASVRAQSHWFTKA